MTVVSVVYFIVVVVVVVVNIGVVGVFQVLSARLAAVKPLKNQISVFFVFVFKKYWNNQ